MSDPTPNPVAVVDPEAGHAPAVVVDKVNDHTPEPVQPPAVEHAPAPPTADDGVAELRAQVENMATALTALTELVTATLSGKDESPARVPWTHRGGKLPHGEDD